MALAQGTQNTPQWTLMKAYSPDSIALSVFGASLVAQTVKRLYAMRETLVRSLGQEDPLQEGMATHCSILAWRMLWSKEPGGLQSTGLQRVGYDPGDLAHTQESF